MTQTDPAAAPYAIIAGYGLPGRFVAELLDYRGFSYRVIERNKDVTSRLAADTRIMCGSADDEELLKRAGIADAKIFALTIPDGEPTAQAIRIAKRLNPKIFILARSAYTSAGLNFQQQGADEIIVAEQLIAREFFRSIENRLPLAGT